MYRRNVYRRNVLRGSMCRLNWLFRARKQSVLEMTVFKKHIHTRRSNAKDFPPINTVTRDS